MVVETDQRHVYAHEIRKGYQARMDRGLPTDGYAICLYIKEPTILDNGIGIFPNTLL